MKACPVCGSEFTSFRSVGSRRDAKCPSCGAYERHRVAWLFFKKCTKLFTEPTRILHFAPEPSFRFRLEDRKNVKYTAASYDPNSPREGVDAQSLPFADNSFDLVYCSHVLEHVDNDMLAMSELRRVVDPSGLVLVMVPQGHQQKTYEDPKITSPEGRHRAFGQSDHVRIYGQDFQSRLESSGFSVRVEVHASRYSANDRARFGLTDVPIYICSKS